MQVTPHRVAAAFKRKHVASARVASNVVIAPDGTRLCARTFGEGGRLPVLCLHGLAGHAGEWADTATALTEWAHVVAFDARGHGGSDRIPADASRQAHVADAVAVVDAFAEAPVVVVGQSLGGQTALLLAAKRPDLVRGLVVAEASPDSGDGKAYVHIEKSLRSWPVPFADRAAAVTYFAARGLVPEPWADGLEQRDDGWWPRFDVEVLVETVREADSRTYWDEWETIRCPILIVRGANGSVSPDHARALVERARNGKLIEIDDAGHDVHLEQPEQWGNALRSFVRSLA